MMDGATREAKAARWLSHLQAWSAAGGSLAGYVRSHGLPAWEAYRWLRILRRQGRWSEPAGARPSSRPTFVRVNRRPVGTRSAEAPANAATTRDERITVVVTLEGGRRVEFLVGSPSGAVALLSALERAT